MFCLNLEVHTYPPLSILLLHHHSVSQPFRVKYFFNSLSLLKFHHLVFDNIIMIFKGMPRWLFSGDDRRVNVQMIIDKVRIHPRSFISIPSEYINVVLKKNYQFLLLPRWQLNPNLKEFFRIIPNGEFLQILTFGLLGKPPRW